MNELEPICTVTDNCDCGGYTAKSVKAWAAGLVAYFDKQENKAVAGLHLRNQLERGGE
jgi:hypothetical protein